MSMKVVICDDSKLARKSLEKALPANWDVDVRLAENGEQALQLIEQGLCELLFLDLTMPVMDGFEVLKAIRERQLNCLTIVVSGDTQENSRNRVQKLGALGFIKKPLDQRELQQLLESYGLIRELLASGHSRTMQTKDTVAVSDILNEIANISLGEAGKLLAEVLGTHIELPLPKVTQVSYANLLQTLELPATTPINAVTEGFVGNEVAGEAILLVDNNTLHQLPEKLADFHRHQFNDEYQSLLLDVASLLIAGFLQRFALQLDLEFNISHPSIVANNTPLYEIFKPEVNHENVLVIDIDYHIPAFELSVDLLVIFTEKSSQVLEQRAEYFADA